MRRIAIVVLLAAALVLPPAAIAGESKELVIASWGGAFQKAQREAYFDPFEKATGIKVIDVSPPKASKVKAMVQSGNVEWDVVVAAGGIFMPCLKQGLVEKIDYKYFDKETLEGLYPEAKKPHAVGTFYFSYVMAYSTEVYSKAHHPRNWAEFWDVKKFPGPRTLHDLSTAGVGGWEFALLADGFPKDQIYVNPDLDRAFKKLTEIKPYVVKWWRQGAEPGQLFMDKEVVLGSAYNGRVQRLKEQGGPVDYIWNEGVICLEYFFIPKGAPNYENALKFIAFASKPGRQAHFSKLFAYGPVNKDAFKLLTEERAHVLPSYPENKEKQVLLRDEWCPDNTPKVIERWNTWILEK
ncbi:MAG: ABC transporter substrate-binding protein [Deltaproteobacteria bacterium]|nr:ABC transporter substrate-binding protein [Deltaproteobacteria bacterium]MBW2121445.1 ABC transporter substrate-binding protein [Deltaproteobacteria bacterium]